MVFLFFGIFRKLFFGIFVFLTKPKKNIFGLIDHQLNMEFFQATEKVFASKKDCLAALKLLAPQCVPVFTTNFNKYSTCGFQPFVESLLVCPSKNKCRCEVLFADKPVKIFIDVDAATSESWFSVEFMNEIFVPRLLKVVKRALSIQGHSLPKECFEPVVLSSHTAEKYSLHVIFQLLMPNLKALKNFITGEVKPMINKLFPDVPASVLDPVVYDGGRLFRVYLTPKPGKANFLVHDEYFAIFLKQQHWTKKKVLLKSLITFSSDKATKESCPESLKSDLLLTENALTLKSRLNFSAAVGNAKKSACPTATAVLSEEKKKDGNAACELRDVWDDREQRIAEILLELLQEKYQKKTFTTPKFCVFEQKNGVLKKTLSFQCNPSMNCPFLSCGASDSLIGHKRNATYLTAQFSVLPYYVACRCADTDCVQYTYYLADLQEMIELAVLKQKYEILNKN